MNDPVRPNRNREIVSDDDIDAMFGADISERLAESMRRDSPVTMGMGRQPEPVAHSDAARLNRLLSILQRLKWAQGEDGLIKPVGPAEALNDLGLFMLGHEIDMAIERGIAPASADSQGGR